MNTRAKFITQINGLTSNNHIHLIDLCNECGSMSITNDAEAVVKQIFEQYGNVRITYEDTDGYVDELVHDRGVFKTFKPGHEGLMI